MKIVINEIGPNYIEVKLAEHISNLEQPEWSNLLFEILKYALLNRAVYAVTLSPQSYSIGYELKNPVEMKSGKDKVILNRIQSCTEELLKEIVESEDFERGLLRLAIFAPNKVEEVINSVFFPIRSYEDIRNAPINYELITCEGDGEILCWFNPPFAIGALKLKLNGIIIKYQE